MQSRPTLADDASNLKNLENPTMHFAVLEKKVTPHGSETTSLHQLDELNDENVDETSLKDFNVKECNAMIIEINDKKFYIIFAQFKQQQFEESQTVCDTVELETFGGLKRAARYLSRNIEYDHTTQYVNLEDTVIKMLSETTQLQSEISTYRRPELVSCTIEI